MTGEGRINPPLINRRLTPPHLLKGLLERTRLLQSLSSGALQGGTIYVVVAPAGYGKTTLLSQYRNLCEVQCWSTAWLGLEDEDNDEASFYTYLSAAFERLAQVQPSSLQPLLAACAACIAADHTVTPDEGELMRAIADAIGCPMPPLLPGQALV